MAVPSQNDLLLALLVETRIQNQLIAEQNGKQDELQQLRTDAAVIFPLLNTILIPNG